MSLVIQQISFKGDYQIEHLSAPRSSLSTPTFILFKFSTLPGKDDPYQKPKTPNKPFGESFDTLNSSL